MKQFFGSRAILLALMLGALSFMLACGEKFNDPPG
jgi:hypothetical protein